MPAVRNVPAPVARRGLLRSLVLAGAAASAAAAVLVPAAVASADTGVATTVVGELVQAWPESEHSGAHAEETVQPQSWIRTAAGTSLPIPTEDVAQVPVGSTVSVTLADADADADGGATGEGAVTGSTVPVLSTTIVANPSAPPVVPARRTTNQVTVALVAPAGSQPDGTTRQQVVDLVNRDVAEFWAEQTDGAVRIGVTGPTPTTDPEWLQTKAGCADAAMLWNEVAAKVKFVAGPGKHLLVYLPRTLTACEYALAEVGRSTTSGGRLYVRDTNASVIAHEFGHNFGLGHSSGRQCDAAVDAGDCRTAGYRDFYDVMGVSWGELGTLNALQAARLKVLPAAQVQTLPVSGASTTVTLSPYSERTGTRALRLTDSTGVDYWLEYRTASGRDAWLGTDGNRYGLDSGVLLRRTGTFPDTSLLLDGTPSRSAGWDGDLQTALPVGTPVAVSGGQFTIELREVTAAGAVVSVVPAPPAAAGTPAPAAAVPAPGAVLPAAGEAPNASVAAPQVAAPQVDVPQVDAPPAAPAPEPVPVPAQAGTAEPSLAAASSEATGGIGALAVAGLGAALAATTLVVKTMRRTVRR